MTDLFHATPGNPPPQNVAGGFFTTRDGKKIRYGLFAAVTRPLKGTVVLLPGRNECIEKYFETIRNLTDRGLGVATLDWRGQGGSDRLLRDPQRGYVRSFYDYTGDLEQFFEEIVLPDCRGPYYILAHSAGARDCAARRAVDGQPGAPHGADRAFPDVPDFPLSDKNGAPRLLGILLSRPRPALRRLGAASRRRRRPSPSTR